MNSLKSLSLAIPFSVPSANILAALALNNAVLPVLKKIIKCANQYLYEGKSLYDFYEKNFALNVLIKTKQSAYERWLAQFVLGLSPIYSLPYAALLSTFEKNISRNNLQKNCMVLQPVHIHATANHLVLTNPQDLNLSTEENEALFLAAKPLLQELSEHVYEKYLHPSYWCIGDEKLGKLITHSLALAIGRNIYDFLPKGPQEKLWRKLHNEIQMIWHNHPVNNARRANGQDTVNWLWLFAGGPMDCANIANNNLANHLVDFIQYDLILTKNTGDPLLAGISSHMKIDILPLSIDLNGQFFTNFTQRKALVWLDQLVKPAYLENYSSWIENFTNLEKNWLQPAYNALQKGQLQQLDIILMGDTWLTITLKILDPWKFWYLWRKKDFFKILQNV